MAKNKKRKNAVAKTKKRLAAAEGRREQIVERMIAIRDQCDENINRIKSIVEQFSEIAGKNQETQKLDFDTNFIKEWEDIREYLSDEVIGMVATGPGVVSMANDFDKFAEGIGAQLATLQNALGSENQQ